MYQNGVRLNEPLGDAVNWDLVPINAVAGLTLLGGSNPLYGLNSLGGSIALRMKNGFTHPGHVFELEGGSYHRFVANVESGGGNERFAWYANLQRFREHGWRDLSDSWAENAFRQPGLARAGGVARPRLPREPVGTSRGTGFPREDSSSETGRPCSRRRTPRRTMQSCGRSAAIAGSAGRGSRRIWPGAPTTRVRSTATGSKRTDSQNLVEVGFGGVDSLRSVLRGGCRDAVAKQLTRDGGTLDGPAHEGFVQAVGESGCGAVNNLSDRSQDALSAVVEFDVPLLGLGMAQEVSAGAGYYRGRSAFRSNRQFALFDPELRSTLGPGAARGGFADDGADLQTRTARGYAYLGDTVRLTDRWTVSLSGFLHASEVTLLDRSGEQPQLNGRHDYRNFNWGVGSVYRLAPDLRGHLSYNQASRLPTPIELACSEALAYNPESGEVEECRLPNAFLADPPLAEVVSKSLEFGLRGERGGVSWAVGAFPHAQSGRHRLADRGDPCARAVQER